MSSQKHIQGQPHDLALEMHEREDGPCICTYMECGRQFTALKFLEEHVTTFHNTSWKDYIKYYHRWQAVSSKDAKNIKDKSKGASNDVKANINLTLQQLQSVVFSGGVDKQKEHFAKEILAAEKHKLSSAAIPLVKKLDVSKTAALAIRPKALESLTASPSRPGVGSPIRPGTVSPLRTSVVSPVVHGTASPKRPSTASPNRQAVSSPVVASPRRADTLAVQQKDAAPTGTLPAPPSVLPTSSSAIPTSVTLSVPVQKKPCGRVLRGAWGLSRSDSIPGASTTLITPGSDSGISMTPGTPMTPRTPQTPRTPHTPSKLPKGMTAQQVAAYNTGMLHAYQYAFRHVGTPQEPKSPGMAPKPCMALTGVGEYLASMQYTSTDATKQVALSQAGAKSPISSPGVSSGNLVVDLTSPDPSAPPQAKKRCVEGFVAPALPKEEIYIQRKMVPKTDTEQGSPSVSDSTVSNFGKSRSGSFTRQHSLPQGLDLLSSKQETRVKDLHSISRKRPAAERPMNLALGTKHSPESPTKLMPSPQQPLNLVKSPVRRPGSAVQSPKHPLNLSMKPGNSSTMRPTNLPLDLNATPSYVKQGLTRKSPLELKKAFVAKQQEEEQSAAAEAGMKKSSTSPALMTLAQSHSPGHVKLTYPLTPTPSLLTPTTPTLQDLQLGSPELTQHILDLSRNIFPHLTAGEDGSDGTVPVDKVNPLKKMLSSESFGFDPVLSAATTPDRSSRSGLVPSAPTTPDTSSRSGLIPSAPTTPDTGSRSGLVSSAPTTPDVSCKAGLGHSGTSSPEGSNSKNAVKNKPTHSPKNGTTVTATQTKKGVSVSEELQQGRICA